MEKLNSSKITQAVIFAGGAGTRLRPFTNKNPKPMILVNGKPFLEHLLNLLKLNGTKEVVILTGYLGDKISKHFKDGREFGIKIKYSYTPFKDYSGEEIKSGIRILNAHELLDDQFLLLYCDNYWPLNLAKLQQIFLKTDVDTLVTVYTNRDNSTKNNTFVDQNGFIKNYDKSRTEKKLNGVDIGFMIVKKKVLSLLPKENCKFEDIVFPSLIRKKKLAGFLTNHKYYSIGDMERVIKTAEFLRSKKVIFLDRDGVINKKASKADYIKKWSEFEFLPGSIEAIRLLTLAKYKIFIITNQAGIARGMMNTKDLEDIHKRMLRELKNAGANISGIYWCPHGWDEGCVCRKPKPGLLYQAADENQFDLTKSVFIGDDERDEEAGMAAGVRTILVNPNNNLLKIVYSLTK